MLKKTLEYKKIVWTKSFVTITYCSTANPITISLREKR